MSDETAPKTRKTRVAGPKAPSRKENPAGYQLHYLDLALKNLTKRDEQTTAWGVASEDGKGLGKHFGDALFSLQEARKVLAGVPVDFRAPRKRGGGGGRVAKRFEPGQTVVPTARVIGLVRELFPDVSTDCTFVVSQKYVATKEDGKPNKMIPVMCTGIGGALPAFYVGPYPSSQLSAA